MEVYKNTKYEKDMVYYNAISAYKEVEKPDDWNCCKDCGLVPLVWEFDNGRSTACGCGKNVYEHPSVHAKPIGDVVRETGGFVGYDGDELRQNWNLANK